MQLDISPDIQLALDRLNSRLPLKMRQDALPPGLKCLHRYILTTLAMQGRPPVSEELVQACPGTAVLDSLRRLSADDLIVLDQARDRVLGAYPLTSEITPHKVSLYQHSLFAMCALDAVSIAPMFNADVSIASHCHVTQTPLAIHMRSSEILSVSPSSEIMIGIRWQMPSAVAAHSMCLQMVFLKDRPTAEAWQNGDQEHVSLFSLAQAVEFGSAFFVPLLT